MPTKEQILAGREAVDAYRQAHTLLHQKPHYRQIHEDHTPLLDKMVNALRKQGFNSLDEFFDANEEACVEEAQRCYRLIGSCDGCRGRERGCIENCYLNRTKPVGTKDERTPLIGGFKDFFDWQGFENNVPPRCSYRFEKIAEPTFDIYWNMREGFKPEVYERLKQMEKSGVKLGGN